jgi:hypothetical protein
MSKTHTELATMGTTIVALTALDMNHIRGGMATSDSEKTKKIGHNGVRNGWNKDWKEEKEEKIKKIKEAKHC